MEISNYEVIVVSAGALICKIPFKPKLLGHYLRKSLVCLGLETFPDKKYKPGD